MRVRRGRWSQAGWNAVGIAVSLVLVFPVYWMVSTAFKPDTEIHSSSPTWFSIPNSVMSSQKSGN